MSRAEAQHDSHCPDIGPICQMRAEPPQQHHTTLWVSDLRLLGEFGFANHFAVQAVVPFRILGTTTLFTDLDGNPIQLDYTNIHHRNEVLAGFGDAQLLLHAATAFGALQVGGRVGASMPFGQVQPNPFKLGEMGLSHQHIQFGTGTFDPVLGLDVAWRFAAWSLAAFGSSQLSLYPGPTGYQAGARIIGGVVGSTGFGLARPTFRLGLTAFHELAERWDGLVPTEDGNRGRTDLFVGAGLTFPFATDWSVNLDVRVRAWGHVVGAQLNMPVLVEVSIGRLLHFESGEHEDDHGDDPGENEHSAGHSDHAEVHREREDGVAGAHSQPARADVQDAVRAGEAAPLAPVPGKWTVFDFWASWCESCKPLDAQLRRLAASEPSVAVRRVNIVDFDSPVALRELPGVTLLPRIRVVSPDGEVVFEQSGTPDELMGLLESELKRVRSTQQ